MALSLLMKGYEGFSPEKFAGDFPSVHRSVSFLERFVLSAGTHV